MLARRRSGLIQHAPTAPAVFRQTLRGSFAGALAREAKALARMDHSLRHVGDLVRPWRTATLVVSVLAAVELVVIVVAVVIILGEPVAAKLQTEAQQRASMPAAPPQPKPNRTGKPALERAETSVLVLNGNGRAGAASAAGATVHAKGYLVSAVGNAPRTDYPRSVVMYRAGYEPEARRLAKDVGIGAVGPLDGMKPRELMGAHIALIIGG